MQEKNFTLNSLDDTNNFAIKIAKFVETGDLITFSGDLGVGKTTFIQNFIKFLTIEDIDVTSPTFNLLHSYKLDKFEVYHYDLYRLKNIEEIYEIGIEDSFHYGVTLIEWPEIIKPILPQNRLEIELSFGINEYSREIKLKTYGKWQNKITDRINN